MVCNLCKLVGALYIRGTQNRLEGTDSLDDFLKPIPKLVREPASLGTPTPTYENLVLDI